MRNLRLQVKIVNQSSHNPKGRIPAPIAEFLHIAPPNVTLEDFTQQICEKYARLYPRNHPLNIQRLQDFDGNDLDLTYTVGDVFDDKSSDREGSIVRVVHKDVLRDESVPPESGLRPASSRKRRIETLATVEEAENDGEEEAEEEDIGVPVNQHRNKRQRFENTRDQRLESSEREDDDEEAVEDEGEHVPASSNVVELSRSRQQTSGSDVHTAESSTGRRVRSPSLGSGSPNGGVNAGDTISLNNLLVPATQERGSSLIPETSQGLVPLLSPKEETFSSPLLFATAHRTKSSSTHPIEVSPEVEALDEPVIALEALKGSTAKKATASKQTGGKLKRPTKPTLTNKANPRNVNSAYDVVPTDDSSSEGEKSATSGPPKKGKAQPLKKLQGPATKRTVAQKPRASDTTPVMEVPSSQSETNASNVSSNFVVEVPHIDEVMNNVRPLSRSSVKNVADLLGSKFRPDEEPSVQVPSSSASKPVKPSPPAKRQSIKKGGKPSETLSTRENSTTPKPSAPVTAKRTQTKATVARKSTTPALATPEATNKNDGKSAAPHILHSALRDPEKKNLEAKKTVSFANEGSPTPATKTNVKPSAIAAKTTAATPNAGQEVRKARTTFKVPLPVIPIEQQGIGDRSTAESRKNFDAFVGKAKRSMSASATPPIGTLASGVGSSKAATDRVPVTDTKSTKGTKPSAEPMPSIKPIAKGKSKQPVNTSKSVGKQKASPTPVEEDEVMEDVSPVRSVSQDKNSTKSPSPSSSSESSTSDSEEEEDKSEEEEDEVEEPDTPQNKPTPSNNKPSKPKNPEPIESSSSSSSSSDESEPEKEIYDIKGALGLSDSDDDDYEETPSRGMVREESPVKGPAKRQLRSSSPEKKNHMRISYDTPASKLSVEPVSESASEDEDRNMDDADADDEASKPGNSIVVKPLRKPIVTEEEEDEDEDEEEEGEEAKSQASENESAASTDQEMESPSQSDNEDEIGTQASGVPTSSISVVPESSIASHKPAIQSQESDDDDDSRSTTTTNTNTSTSKVDSDEDSVSGSEQEEKSATPEPEPPKSSVKAMQALFRKPATVPKNPSVNGTQRPPPPQRFSKTPEPSQPSNSKPMVTFSPSKLPPSRMNRSTLGYISPSPQPPPSSMPPRLPSQMLPPKDARKRTSLNKHYKGLSMLSEQEIPETRESGRTPTLAKAAVITSSGGANAKSRLSQGRQAFDEIFESQKGGKDTDDDDSDGSSDSDGSQSSDEEEEGKEKSKDKKFGLKSLWAWV
ncbi:hypothetical protein TWF694_011010 [Orbilia ellipsospora]|uniref:Nucleolar protein Dnt1-like N-terminal domain-containing protein n=1 Tax=Orbilia ellipsospora TaxID=2528407 RepID=A0AAV9XDZ9_9PEZI